MGVIKRVSRVYVDSRWCFMYIASTQYSLKDRAYDVFVSGCCKKCKNCYNQELWDSKIGRELDLGLMSEISSELREFSNMIDKVRVMGGEVLEKSAVEIKSLIKCLNIARKELWLFTGYELKEIDGEIVKQFDYVKCGGYRESERADNYVMYGVDLASSNQKVYKKGQDY